MINVRPMAVDWHPWLPVFAKGSFLESVGDEHGWLGGFADDGKLLCILPYTIIRKSFIRIVRFRTETIPVEAGLDEAVEKEFLNRVVDHFRASGAGLIMPATTNAIFRMYPDAAEAVPYGSYRIDLRRPEEVLWKNVHKVCRQNISTARNSGICVKDGRDRTGEGYDLIRLTFKRSRLPFMERGAFDRFLAGLGGNGLTFITEYEGRMESFCAFAFSDCCAYAVYAGNIDNMRPGGNKLLHWEAMLRFKGLGVTTYDFTGARINPEPGSKQEALANFKKRFGAELKVGYMWKCPLNPWQYRLYNLAARVRSGGDIVDGEKRRLGAAKS